MDGCFYNMNMFSLDFDHFHVNDFCRVDWLPASVRWLVDFFLP